MDRKGVSSTPCQTSVSTIPQYVSPMILLATLGDDRDARLLVNDLSFLFVVVVIGFGSFILLLVLVVVVMVTHHTKVGKVSFVGRSTTMTCHIGLNPL